MSTPLFSDGQSVSVAVSKRYRLPEGAYRVISAMPSGGGRTLYRIKGDLEKFERVIDEIHLAASAPIATPVTPEQKKSKRMSPSAPKTHPAAV